LVILASAGICAALNLQKLVHVRNQDPHTGAPRTHFMALPLWWIAVLANTLSELINLAALGFAPATLVTPLGCLTVVFNALASVLWLGEPFFLRDILGILLIFAGVAFVVLSQLGSQPVPIDEEYLHSVVLRSPTFYAYLGGLAVAMAVLVVFVQPRWSTKYCWVYLGESAICGSITTVAARAFASMLGPPLPGQWAFVYTPPHALVLWGALAVLVITALSSLMLQNKAMMHFQNSEVVPVYFCLFAFGGVIGSALVYQEFCYPWVLLLLPGLLFCALGVYAISYKREERIARAEPRNRCHTPSCCTPPRQPSAMSSTSAWTYPPQLSTAHSLTSLADGRSELRRSSSCSGLNSQVLTSLAAGTLAGTLATVRQALHRTSDEGRRSLSMSSDLRARQAQEALLSNSASASASEPKRPTGAPLRNDSAA